MLHSSDWLAINSLGGLIKEESNDHRRRINRNVNVGTVAYIDRSLIPHTLSNPLQSYGAPRGNNRHPVVGGTLIGIKEAPPRAALRDVTAARESYQSG